MKSLLGFTIIMMVMGCAKSSETKTEKDFGSMNTIDSYKVVFSE